MAGEGRRFEDDPVLSNLAQIKLRVDSNNVMALQCVYEDGSQTSEHLDIPRDRREIFALNKDEAVIAVRIWTDSTSARPYVTALQFTTNKGRQSQRFGGSDGSATLRRGFDGTQERALMGFKGSLLNRFWNLEPIWSDTRKLDSQPVVVGEWRGWETRADDFDMLTHISDPSPASLRAINVSYSNVLRTIECTFKLPSGKEVKTGSYGGGAGTKHDFQLGPDERIIRVEGRAGARIDRLQFFTDQTRSSPVYGGDGGEPFIWTPPQTGATAAVHSDMSLLCFQGVTGGDGVYRLAPVWAANPPTSYNLTIDSFDEIKNDMMGTPEVGWSSHWKSDNAGDTPVERTAIWTMQASKSTTVTLSSTSRWTIGGKLTFKVGAKGKAGVPFVVEGKLNYEAGIEVSGGHEWGSTATDGTTVTRTYTETISEKVTVPPKKTVIGKATGFQMRLTNLKWKGTMSVTYNGGSIKTYPVDGTIDSVSMTRVHTSYETKDLEKD